MSRFSSVSSGKPNSKDNSFSEDPESFPEFNIISTLGKSKFLVVKAQVPDFLEPVAMKIFPNQNSKPHSAYKIESKFSKLQHENVIRILKTEDTFIGNYQNNALEGSAILMELAKCDMVEIIENVDLSQDETLVRTIFHDIVNGLDYIHSQGVAHLDLKPENILLGSDGRFKLADSDFSFDKNDRKINGRGTEHYRAPEIRDRCCKNPFLSDIYSLGIVLFILRARIFPFLEGKLIRGIDLEELVNNDIEGFVAAHKTLGTQTIFSEEFIELFSSMAKRNESERCTLRDVKNSKWFNGPTYTNEEMKALFFNKN